MTPTPKVAAGGVAGLLAVVIAWTVGQFGIDMPDYVAVAFGGLLMFVVSWAKGDGDPPGQHAA